jgi:tetratricopeptide (TPR) repeat protein/TolB-like protein
MPHFNVSLEDAETIVPPARQINQGALRVGDAFGPRYHILRLLGTGGMGTVYHAWDNELGIALALKVIRPEALHDQTAADDVERRFKRELLLARQVTHKNVVRIHDLGEMNGIRYITMPFIDGADLSTVLKKNGRLPLGRALALSRQIVAGLVAAHEVGVVHRDLKPANIMVGGDDHALIMDFGIARSTSGTSGVALTQGVVGTLEYMAPEQARSEPADHRADIYAFGLILYDMLVGRHHVGVSESVVTDLMQRMRAVPPSARAIDPTVPEEIDRLINTCLEPDPSARFQTTEALAAALARLDADGRLIGGTTFTEAPRAAAAPHRLLRVSRHHRLLLATVVAVAVVATALWWETRVEPSPIPQADAAATASTTGTFIAVLPLTVTDDAMAHVATGIGEALSAKLFQLKDVRLASGSAVERAAGLGSPEKIGRNLGVNLIVTGAVQAVGDRLRIDINVDDVQGGRRLSARQYTGVPEDLLTLEDQIYHELIAAVGVMPGNEELARAAVHPTENFEAYELYLKGRNAMRGQQDPKNVQSAIKLYEQALAKDTGFALAYSGIADAALQMYRYTRDNTWTARAVAAAQQAASLDDKLVEVHLALGNAYRLTGRAAEGITELRIATQLAPNSDDSYRQLGRAYLQAGRSTEAIEALQKAVDINPYFWVNHNTLGGAFLQLADYDKAIQANRKVIDLEPDNVNGYNDLGAAYLSTGRFAEAAGVFEKALKLLPNPDTYTNLGIAYYYLGRFREAVPPYEKAVELSPNDEQFAGNLADGYRWAGQLEKANATYDRAIALALKQLRTNPRNASVRGNIGLYYAKKGDVTQGAKFLKDARAVDRTNVYLIYNEALAYALANRPSEAIGALEEAFAAGYQVSMAASDPDLKALRSDPRFEGLLKEYSRER